MFGCIGILYKNDTQIRQGKILHTRGSNRSNGFIECNWRKFRKEVERFLQLFIADRIAGWVGWVLEILIPAIKEGGKILVAYWNTIWNIKKWCSCGYLKDVLADTSRIRMLLIIFFDEIMNIRTTDNKKYLRALNGRTRTIDDGSGEAILMICLVIKEANETLTDLSLIHIWRCRRRG